MLLNCGYFFAIVFYIYVTSINCEPAPKQDITSEIANGVTAAPIIKKRYETLMKNTGNFPYIASLEIKPIYRFKCGAVIIREDIVLTAGHCIKELMPTDLRVRAGAFDLSDILAPTNQVRKIKQFIRHPDYFKSVDYNYDVAILWLENRFTFGEFVGSINLSKKDYSGESTFALGWGTDQTGDRTEFLMRGDFIVLPRTKCKKLIVTKPGQEITNSMVCAQNKLDDQAICTGDSGGPLVFRKKSNNIKDDVLVGISSWGIVYPYVYSKEGKDITTSYCNSSYPSVFVNIKTVRSWILKNIK